MRSAILSETTFLKSYVFVIAKALHWFNPLVWIGVKKMKEDMEFSCDQHVFQAFG